MTESENWLYRNNPKDTVRYVLGEKGEHMVACIGINPSTARPNALDNTLKSVKRIALFNGFDGWVMYNVYPQRATNPKQLHAEMDSNLQLKNSEILRQSIRDLGIDTIWLAFGDIIESRAYLSYCMLGLYTHLKPLDVKWKIIAETTKKGHPKHPLYKPTESLFVDFDMEKYVNEKLMGKQLKSCI
jgi:hypothetical protein